MTTSETERIVKRASRRSKLASKGIGAAIVGSAVLPNETGRRFFHRSIGPEARQRKKKARKNHNQSKRRNR